MPQQQVSRGKTPGTATCFLPGKKRMDTQVKADTARLSDTPQPTPYTSRYVEAGGLRLHYLDYGTPGRQPMVCLHGGAANAHWYDFVAAQFNRDYHVIALDARGHGDSQWSDPPAYTFEDYAHELDQVVRKLDLRDIVLIGHSMGGKTALTYTALYPQRVARLVVIDSNMLVSSSHVSEMQDIGKRPNRSYASREDYVARFHVRPEGTVAAAEILQHLGRLSCRQMPDGGWQHKFDRNIYAQQRVMDPYAYWERVKVPAMLMKAALSARVTKEIVAEARKR